MVLGIFSRKIDRRRIYQEARRVERHVQSLIIGSEHPVENMMEEFDQVLAEISAIRSPEMLEPFLRLEELSTDIISSFYAHRICFRLHHNLKRPAGNVEIALYEKACLKHYDFLCELDTVFYPEIIRRRDVAAMLANRQFHWLCELTKLCCLKGTTVPQDYFAAADGLLAVGDEQGIANESIAPYPKLYPEERASLVKNQTRQYLMTSFFHSELPAADLDVVNTLWRIMPFDQALISDKKTAETTHFIQHQPGKNVLQRVHPDLDERNVQGWFSGLRLAEALQQQASHSLRLTQETALGELFAQVINEKSIGRVATFLGNAPTRENKRARVNMETEVFTELTDCICYLRRINDDFLIALSDVDETRRFNPYGQFEETKFGYVEGYVNQTLKSTVNENIARTLTRKMEADYGTCGLAPALWRIDNASATGYGLLIPKDTKPPEIGSIVIVSRENDNGIEFAIARRFNPGSEHGTLGVELLFAGCDADPFFVLYCKDSDGRFPAERLIDPYGFLLTDNDDVDADRRTSVLLVSRKLRLPDGGTMRLKTLENRLDGQIAEKRDQGRNWVAYQWNPL